MLEATVRILNDEGLKALSTNRIAEVAGVSIGTLYQYFRSKEDVIERLVEHEVAQVTEKIERALKSDLPTGSEERVRLLVRTLLGAFGGRPRVRKLIFEAGLTQNSRAAMGAGRERIAALLGAAAAERAKGGDNPLPPMAVFVISTAVMNVIRGAVLQDESWLSSPELEECLVRLICGFVSYEKKS
jgi:AcrR family transcriptional regulator